MELMVARECFDRADETLGRIKMGQNPVKRAGHHTFWVHKLKPFAVDWDSIEELEEVDTSPLFFNEYASVMFGFRLLALSGYRFHLDVDLVHDLVAGLRYETFSPASVSAVYRSMLINYPAVVGH
ncbi:MAG: hypothetical protein HQL66_07225 [Magnetococcales bacterium]|nr:hypothetical protein [Magnetococcales bacterium]